MKYWAFSLLFLIGCAKPRYVHQDGTIREQSTCSKIFSGNLCVELKWEKAPAVAEDGSFAIVITNQNGLLTNANVTPFVELYMPAHHHGSSLVDVTPIAPGIYRAEHVNFLMPGDWEVRIQLRDGESVKEQVVWTITL